MQTRAVVQTGPRQLELREMPIPAIEEALKKTMNIPVFHDDQHGTAIISGAAARWLRGGFWRNFQVKYREINDLHKQMLRTSAKARV